MNHVEGDVYFHQIPMHISKQNFLLASSVFAFTDLNAKEDRFIALKIILGIGISVAMIPTFASIGEAAPLSKTVSAICSYTSRKSDITDRQCRITVEGTIDSKYRGRHTNLPGKISVAWSDGTTTSIIFEGLTKIGSMGEEPRTTHSGIAMVDGKGHIFTRRIEESDLACFDFGRLADDLSEKNIRVCY